MTTDTMRHPPERQDPPPTKRRNPHVTTVQTIEVQPDDTVLMTTYHFGERPPTHELHQQLALHIAGEALTGGPESTLWRCASMLITAGVPAGSRLNPATARVRLKAMADAIRPLITPEGDT